MSKGNIHIGVDSQCLSYLLDAINDVLEPTDALADERKALIRIWFYQPGPYFVTQTVVNECRRIKNAERKAFHQSFIDSLFANPPNRDNKLIENRTKEFFLLHPYLSDCRILAESEEIGLNVLLTYDRKFMRRLSQSSSLVRLITPSEYWTGLYLPLGSRPLTVPHQTNPLSLQTWWRW